jgi:hypothetical protein
VKAGPFEAEFDQVQAEVREELARSPELAEAQVPASASQVAAPASSLRDELSALADLSPASAIVEASKRIEHRLSEMLADSSEPPQRKLPIRVTAGVARERGLISDETLAAIEGMSVLRSLAAHSRDEIGVDRAHDYLTLADAVMYVLRPKPTH